MLEFEQLVKLSFADHGTREDALRTISATFDWARQRNEENLAAAKAYAEGDGPFQYRAAQGMLAGAFFTDYYAMVARWASWAHEQVERWPEDPADAVADLADLAEIAQRAQWSSSSAAVYGVRSAQAHPMGRRRVVQHALRCRQRRRRVDCHGSARIRPVAHDGVRVRARTHTHSCARSDKDQRWRCPLCSISKRSSIKQASSCVRTSSTG